MAWIKNTNESTTRLYDAELDVDVDFNANGTAQVSDETAAALCDRYEAIEPYESDGDEE